MKEENEIKLEELLDKTVTVIRNHPATHSIEESSRRENSYKVYWSEQREDGQHHAYLYLDYGNRRVEISDKIRIWVTLRDVYVLDFAGDRVIPIGSGTESYWVEFNSNLSGEVDGIIAVLEAAQKRYVETLAELEASLS